MLLGVPRRNVPLMPLVMTLAAVGIAWLWVTVGGWIAQRASSRKKPPPMAEKAPAE